MASLNEHIDAAETRRVRIGDTDLLAIDFTDQLDSGELLSTVVSDTNAVPVISGGGGTIGAGTVITVATVIDGRTVAIGKGVTILWTAPTTAGIFLVTFGVTTDSSRQLNRNVTVAIVVA